MKKIMRSASICLLAVVILLITGFGAYALPLYDDGVDVNGYTVVDRSVGGDTESYNDQFFGWKASTNDEPYSGYYLGTVEGNTNTGDQPEDNVFIDIFSYYYLKLKSENFEFHATYKVDDVEHKTTPETEGPLTVTWEDDLKSGTWSLETPYEFGFYSVGIGTEFAIYYVEPTQSSGNWWTGHIENPGGQQPEISHFVGATTTTTPVPEPSAMLLMGAGLFGIVAFGKRRRVKS